MDNLLSGEYTILWKLSQFILKLPFTNYLCVVLQVHRNCTVSGYKSKINMCMDEMSFMVSDFSHLAPNMYSNSMLLLLLPLMSSGMLSKSIIYSV